MAHYPKPIEQLILAVMRLPGVGRKTAERFTFYFLKQTSANKSAFINNLQCTENKIVLCKNCQNFSETELCSICSDTQRNQRQICVVSDQASLLALEQTNQWLGVYYVLGGTINPLRNNTTTQLRIKQLLDRVKENAIQEIMLATNPDAHGETTALHITELLKPFNIKITRLARGLPAGSDIEYADDVTLGNALKDRKIV